APDFIKKAIEEPELSGTANSKVIWLGVHPKTEIVQKSKKGSHWEVMSLVFQTRKTSLSIQVEPGKGAWLLNILPKLSIYNPSMLTVQMIKDDYENSGLENFELFWDNKPVNTLYKAGLLHL
ncbi:MAG TPA: radical SAM protein, partial [Chitinophagaceae bacterium]|nr:radical SAM protein [Chitinophagaceae bacterium]